MLVRSKFYAGLIGRLGRWRDGQDSHVVDLLRGASIAGVLKALAAIIAFGLSVVLGRILQNILFGYFVWAKLGILMIILRSLIQRSVDRV